MRPDSPAINPEIVRSYDIRGRVGEQLTLQDARALGLAVATAAHRRRLQRIAVSRDGRTVYTADGLSDAISVIDAQSRKVTATVKVGRQPWGVAVSP